MLVEPAHLRLVAPALARRVAAPAFDALSPHERSTLRDANPLTFLHALHEDPADGQSAIERSAAGLRRLLEAGAFEQQPAGMFVYRMGEGAHSHVAVIARMRAAEMRRCVYPHEATKPARVAHLLDYSRAIGWVSSPVAVAHRPSRALDEQIRSSAQHAPLLDFVTVDGLRQTVWRIDDPTAVRSAFASIERAYITDGHHRVAAAAAAGDDIGVLVALSATDNLDVMEFNRVIAGIAPEVVLDGLEDPHLLGGDDWSGSPSPGEVLVSHRGRWWRAGLPPPTALDVASALDAAVLHDHVLRPIGIADDDARLRFIPGTVPVTTVAAENADAVVVCLAPVSFDDVVAVADARGIMPPKSTYFRPKPRSGIFLHQVASAGDE